MPARLSPRLAAIVDALPVQPHSRVLEIGCGPGAAARVVAARLTTGHILAVDRSATAIAQAEAAAAEEIRSGRMSVRQVAAEDLVLRPDEEPYDIVYAVRVGALDGRHPEAGQRALRRIAMATKAGARLFIDGGDPLRELRIPRVDLLDQRGSASVDQPVGEHRSHRRRLEDGQREDEGTGDQGGGATGGPARAQRQTSTGGGHSTEDEQ
jgi:SAM-dependent methyltransferase